MKREIQEYNFSKEDVLAMFSEEEEEIVSLLICEAQSRIHADYEKAHSQYRAFLLHLETNLTDFSLTIGRARDAAKLNRNNTYSTDFLRITGMKPRDYLEYHRLQLAQEIVRHTRADIYLVAFAVGIEDQSVFSRTYKKLTGNPPSKEPKAGTSETNEKIAQLKSLAVHDSVPADPRVAINTTEIDSDPPLISMADFRLDIESMGRKEIKRYCLRHVDSLALDHFRYLLEQAKYQGRKDREKGEILTLLALDVLRFVEFWDGREYKDEKALGYATLANACRLQFKLDEARKWLLEACAFLPSDRSKKPLLFAQVHFFRVSLLWWQRDVGSDLYDSSGHPERAMPLHLEAISLVDLVDDTFLVFSVHFNMTLFYTRLSEVRAAVDQFEQVKRLYPTVVGMVSPFFMSYLEGSVCRINRDSENAKALFLEAKEGFVGQGLDIYAALTSLDLALVFMDLSQYDKAYSTAIEAVPAVSRFRGHQEAIAALAILQEAENRRSIDRSILRKALHHLDLVRKDPTSNFFGRHKS